MGVVLPVNLLLQMGLEASMVPIILQGELGHIPHQILANNCLALWQNFVEL